MPFQNPRALGAVATLLAALTGGGPALAGADGEPAPSASDFGGVGLLQTPSARAMPDGGLAVTLSQAWPYRRYALTAQVLPWLEATLRYTDVRNRLYGPEEFSGDQTYKDRGIDLKVRLAQETASWPALAIGLRDVGGTGLFQSEYFVANKAFGPLDLSLGVAWGNLGSRGHLANPLGLLSRRFERRGGLGGPGGVALDFFRGNRVGLFGGAAWDTPLDGVRLKLEYDANSYQEEALGNRLPVASPINAAVEYNPNGWLSLSAGIERGNRLLARITVSTNANEPSRMPKLDRPAPAMRPASPSADRQNTSPAERPVAADLTTLRRVLAERAAAEGLWVDSFEAEAGGVLARLSGEPRRDAVLAAYEAAGAALREAGDGQRVVRVEVPLQGGGQALVVVGPGLPPHAKPDIPAMPDPGPPSESLKALGQVLEGQGIRLLAADFTAPEATIYVSQNRYRQGARAIGRAVRAAGAALPSPYEVVTVVLVEDGLETVRATVPLDAMRDALRRGRGSAEELRARTLLGPGAGGMEGARHQTASPGFPAFDWSLRPALRQTLGRPEAFVLVQLWARLSANVQFTPNWAASGGVGLDIYNNFGKLRQGSDSLLPRVRSDIAEYLAEGTTALTYLQTDYTAQLGPGLFARAYGGLLEEMFAGVGGEVLYRPFSSAWAIGADLNWVRQRGYGQWFKFRDYDVVTGHVTGYYHWAPLDVDASLKVGRYLAGDVGATLDLSRTFASGIRIGAFATLTDVSAEEFGEGRFDKGIYVTLPLDQILVRSVRGELGWLWRPTLRDGGQLLSVRGRLADTTDGASLHALERGWASVLD